MSTEHHLHLEKHLVPMGLKKGCSRLARGVKNTTSTPHPKSTIFLNGKTGEFKTRLAYLQTTLPLLISFHSRTGIQQNDAKQYTRWMINMRKLNILNKPRIGHLSPGIHFILTIRLLVYFCSITLDQLEFSLNLVKLTSYKWFHLSYGLL